MKITIEKTDTITSFDGVPVRLWRGVTAGGVRCYVYVHRLAVHPDEDSTEFDQELEDRPPPAQDVALLDHLLADRRSGDREDS